MRDMMYRLAFVLPRIDVDAMLSAMTVAEIAEWSAFLFGAEDNA